MKDPKNARLLAINAIDATLFLQLNNKKSWWKTKRSLCAIKKGHFVVIDFSDSTWRYSEVKDLNQLYLRKEGSKKVFSVLNTPLCEWK